MKNFLTKNKNLILGTIIGFLLVFAIASLVTEKHLSVYKTLLDDNIAEQIKSLGDLAIVTGRGASNDRAEILVKECRSEERSEFEALLASLNSELNKYELGRLTNLFADCGHVFANRRTSMYLQMQDEFNELKTLVEMRKQFENFDDNSINYSKWEELVRNEEEISKIFQDMVRVQGEIINVLLSGKNVNSEEVNDLLKEAQEIKTKLGEATEKASSIRVSLIST